MLVCSGPSQASLCFTVHTCIAPAAFIQYDIILHIQISIWKIIRYLQYKHWKLFPPQFIDKIEMANLKTLDELQGFGRIEDGQVNDEMDKHFAYSIEGLARLYIREKNFVTALENCREEKKTKIMELSQDYETLKIYIRDITESGKKLYID